MEKKRKIVTVLSADSLLNEQWEKLYALRKIITEMRNEKWCISDIESLKKIVERQFQNNDKYSFLILENNKEFEGIVELVLNEIDTANEHLFIRPFFMIPERPYWIIKEVANIVMKFHDSKNEIYIDTFDDSGDWFAHEIGGELRNQFFNLKYFIHSHSHLYYERHYKEIMNINNGFTITVCSSIPEELLLAYFELYSNVSTEENLHFNNVECRESFEEFLIRESYRQSSRDDYIYCMVFNSEKNLVGITVDCVEKNINLRQEITGVHPIYRGRGFGLMMKHCAYAYIRENYPLVDEVTTVIAEENLWMIKINKKLGFNIFRVDKRYSVDNQVLYALCNEYVDTTKT